MKTKTRRGSILIAMTTVVPLALAGCSDPDDFPLTTRKDAGAATAGFGGSALQGSGMGGTASISTGGAVAMAGSAGAGGAVETTDASTGIEDAASPLPAKLGMALFGADLEDGKTDSWKTYDGTLTVYAGGAGASAKALSFRTTTMGSIGKAVTAGSPTATSFALEADIMFLAPGQGSLIFRVSMPSAGGPDSLTAYGVGLDTTAGNVWAARFANMWSPLGTVPKSLATSTWYHLRVDVQPGGFVVFLDDTFVMGIVDSTLLDAGMIGVRGDWGPMGDAGTLAPEVLFDNVKQSALAADGRD